MIHLVNMPFASLLRPSLPLSQIKAQLAEVGLPARVFNLNFDFALEAGFEAFEMVALLRGVDSQIGEWLFAESAWGRPVGPPEEEFLRICGTETESLKQLGDPVGWLRTLKHEVVPSFLDACVDRLASFGEPKVVGFSCTFFQTIASLALARRLRERYPNVKLVFGGACFHDQMGQELIRKVELVDAVSLGEADDVIVPLFQALWEGRAPEGLHAVWYRDEAGEVVEGPAHRPVTEAVLEAIPDPDYDDYFEDMERVGLNDRRSLQRVFLPYESSRGCWWGQKQHCTFCGLNGDGMSFRAKSAEKVLKTIDGLLERYPKATKLQASDNIMPAPYYKNFLPELAKRRQQRSFELFYEIKANVTREKVRALGAAGVAYVQPGIESLSTPLLKLLRKGVSALQNVHLIKLCRTYGVIPAWNILIRLPGEAPEHYAEMAALIPKIIGSYSNVVGLPLAETAALLHGLGYKGQ